MSRVESAGELPAAWRAASPLDPSCSRSAGSPAANTPSGCCRASAAGDPHRDAADFYDYQAKYFATTRGTCPSAVGRGEKHLRELALATFAATGAAGWGRVDFVMDEAGSPPARDQHRARHDRPLPRADGGARARHRFRRARVAGPRDQLHAYGGERVIWAKPKKKVNRRKDGEGGSASRPVLARLAIGAAVLAVLAIAGVVTLGALDQHISQVAVTGRFQRVSPVEVEQA